MNWKVLKTEDDYNKASIRMMEIFNAEPNTPQSDELDLLIVLIKDYDENLAKKSTDDPARYGDKTWKDDLIESARRFGNGGGQRRMMMSEFVIWL